MLLGFIDRNSKALVAKKLVQGVLREGMRGLWEEGRWGRNPTRYPTLVLAAGVENSWETVEIGQKLAKDPVTDEDGWFFTVEVPHHNRQQSKGKLALFHVRKRDEQTLRRIE
jgi:hypothetical protein